MKIKKLNLQKTKKIQIFTIENNKRINFPDLRTAAKHFKINIETHDVTEIEQYLDILEELKRIYSVKLFLEVKEIFYY